MKTLLFSILPMLSIIFLLVVWGMGIYALMLLIKSLKIYIKNNS